MGEHFPVAMVIDAPVARHPHPQPQRMPDHRHIRDRADHGIAVAALNAAPWAAALAVVEQGAEHHRDLTVDGGVSDRHAEFNGAHDRVGNNSSSTGRSEVSPS